MRFVAVKMNTPALQIAPSADPLVPECAEDGQAETILIVDDSDINRIILGKILTRVGYPLLEASDGIEAVAIALRERPDLILLDVMMPRQDGYATCAMLKQHADTAEIPIIFLSALAESADKVKGLQLGAVDYVTKPFDQGEILARVGTHLKIRRLTRELLATNAVLKDRQGALDEDVRAAGDIQRSLLPRTLSLSTHVAMASRFHPCENIGGDLFNALRLDDRHLAVYIFDVSGHGVPAAMVTVSLSQSLSPDGGLIRANGRGWIAPRDVLTQLDREYPIERFDKFFTISYAVLDTETGMLRYSSAGHPMPIVLHASGAQTVLTAGGTIIGLGNIVPFDEGEIVLGPGDRLFLYTDGIVELENRAGVPFGERALHDAIARGAAQSLDGACDTLMSALFAFGEGRELQDDVTLLALEYRGRGTGRAVARHGQSHEPATDARVTPPPFSRPAVVKGE